MNKQLGYTKALFTGHEYDKSSTLYNIELQFDDFDPVRIKIAFEKKDNPNLDRKNQVLIVNRLIQVLYKGADI